MWARIIECMLGVWLILSPFIFRHDPKSIELWVTDFSFGGLLIVLSLASYWQPTHWSHWLLLPVGGSLFFMGRWSESPPLVAGQQNEIFVGLLVMMFAIIPNGALRPPLSWRRDEQEGPSTEPS